MTLPIDTQKEINVMGIGVELAKELSPEHAAAIDNMKDQLLIVLIKRAGGSVDIPVEEIDDTGQDTLSMSLDGRTFHFETGKKQ